MRYEQHRNSGPGTDIKLNNDAATAVVIWIELSSTRTNYQ